MMNIKLYDAKGDEIKAQEAPERAPWWAYPSLVIGIALMAIGFVTVTRFLLQKTEKHLAGNAYGDSLSTKSDAAFTAEMKAAVAAWEQALDMGKPSTCSDGWCTASIHITAPAVVRGSCSSPISIACYAKQEYAGIVIVSNLTTEDPKTVFMHEIGHMLGLDHIEGDPLMDANYSEKLNTPSEASIALARLKLGLTRKKE